MLRCLDMYYLEIVHIEQIQHIDDDKYNTITWICEMRETAHSTKIWNAPRLSRQAFRTDRGVGHHVSAVCEQCKEARAEPTCLLVYALVS